VRLGERDVSSDMSSPAYHPILVSKYSGTFEEECVRVASIRLVKVVVAEHFASAASRDQ
jgi:hypothetical protein